MCELGTWIRVSLFFSACVCVFMYLCKYGLLCLCVGCAASDEDEDETEVTAGWKISNMSNVSLKDSSWKTMKRFINHFRKKTTVRCVY